MQKGNKALEKIRTRLDDQDLVFATEKTEVIILEGPQKMRDSIKLSIRGKEITPKKTLKYLGIHLDN